jgi:xanthine dehydrogenase accessory factor
MTVVTSPDALHADVDGERVWFCCPGCRRAFLADPGKYPGS